MCKAHVIGANEHIPTSSHQQSNGSGKHVGPALVANAHDCVCGSAVLHARRRRTSLPHLAAVRLLQQARQACAGAQMQAPQVMPHSLAHSSDKNCARAHLQKMLSPTMKPHLHSSDYCKICAMGHLDRKMLDHTSHQQTDRTCHHVVALVPNTGEGLYVAANHHSPHPFQILHHRTGDSKYDTPSECYQDEPTTPSTSAVPSAEADMRPKQNLAKWSLRREQSPKTHPHQTEASAGAGICTGKRREAP